MAAAGSSSKSMTAAKEVGSWDANPKTAEAAQKASVDPAEADRLFGARLAFGTAGLRGPMGPGSNMMNTAVVIQTALGLAKACKEAAGSAAEKDMRTRGAVIAFDHRAAKEWDESSERMAAGAAAALAASGMRVVMFDRYMPTPMVPFLMREQDALCGCMVTASHNPKEDAGFKVYWAGGSQIIPPVDGNIARAIQETLDPRATLASTEGEASASLGAWWGQASTAEDCFAAFGKDSPMHRATGGFVERVGPEALDRFVASGKDRMCRGVAAGSEGSLDRPFAVYTAMHGVGTPGILRAMRAWGHASGGQGLEGTYGGGGWAEAGAGAGAGAAAGAAAGAGAGASETLRGILIVDRQCSPDPLFPTVEYPNPEEGKGALALAFEEARRSHEAQGGGKGEDDEWKGPRVVVANDPDADRLALAERLEVPASAGDDESWRVFSGNETAVLLADWALRGWQEGRMKEGFASKEEQDAWEARPWGDEGNMRPQPYMLATAVTTRAVSRICSKEGLGYADTLTGFKWLGARANALREQGHPVLATFEEAIGFCCGGVVPDKDGITAACVALEMAKHWSGEGSSLAGRLGDLYEKYGFFASSNGYGVTSSQEVIRSVFSGLRGESESKGEGPAGAGAAGGSGGEAGWKRFGAEEGAGSGSSGADGAWPEEAKEGAKGLLSELKAAKREDGQEGTPSAFSVVHVRDLSEGRAFDSQCEGGKPDLPLSSSPMVTVWLRGPEGSGVEGVLTLRTSGTEPKIKYYAECSAPTREGAARAAADLRLAVIEMVLRPGSNEFDRIK